jgi:glycosyltransferase involved in cell wall biosynthesis
MRASPAADVDNSMAAGTSAGTATRIAVLVPCHNEEAAIEKVVADFKAALPAAAIYVYDNVSSDRTSELAARAGAIVRREPMKGKGHVVRRMLADVEADVYVLVDGDATYDAASAPAMVELLQSESLDMVTGERVTGEQSAYRPGHRWGNVWLTGLVGVMFGNRIHDMLSGYRVLSRRFVKSFPILSKGFEIETEMTIHALELRMPVAGVPTPYGARPNGSNSKLSTLKDGVRILLSILKLIEEKRPLAFFGVLAIFLALLSLVLAYPLFVTYFETGLVPRFPTAILTSAIMLLAFLSLSAGVILDTVTRGRREAKRMWYLSLPGPRRS